MNYLEETSRCKAEAIRATESGEKYRKIQTILAIANLILSILSSGLVFFASVFYFNSVFNLIFGILGYFWAKSSQQKWFKIRQGWLEAADAYKTLDRNDS